MGWHSLNDLFRQDTEEEAEWASKHAPNLAIIPRGWRPTEFIAQEEAALQDGEDRRAQVNRLTAAGYAPAAIAVTLDISVSRVNQINQDERRRVGIIPPKPR